MKTTRRNFIQTTGAVMALPTGIFGAVAPNDRIGLGLLGCGRKAVHHMQSLVREEEAQVIAVCDPIRERREKAKKYFDDYYGGKTVAAFEDPRDLLARKDIDAVIIVTPDHWHVPLAVMAGKAGKDVYCEKPLSLSMEWSKILRSVFQEKKRILQYGTQNRSMGNIWKACNLARNGYLGEIKSVDVWSPDVSKDIKGFRVKPWGSHKEAPVPEGTNWDIWVGPSPWRKHTVEGTNRMVGFHNSNFSIGFIAGWAAHPLSVAQWGLNRDHTAPVRYEGTGKIPPIGSFYDTVYAWDVRCEYADGVKMHFMGDRAARPVVTKYRKWAGDGTTFHGTEGWVSVGYGGIEFSDPKLGKLSWKDSDKLLHRSPGHHRDFLQCIRTRKNPVAPLEAAIRSDSISHLSELAVRSGQVVEWDPEKEILIGKKGELSLPCREARKPWSL